MLLVCRIITAAHPLSRCSHLIHLPGWIRLNGAGLILLFFYKDFQTKKKWENHQNREEDNATESSL